MLFVSVLWVYKHFVIFLCYIEFIICYLWRMQSRSRGKPGGLGNPPHKATFGGNFLLVYREKKKKGLKGKGAKRQKIWKLKIPILKWLKKKKRKKEKNKTQSWWRAEGRCHRWLKECWAVKVWGSSTFLIALINEGRFSILFLFSPLNIEASTFLEVWKCKDLKLQQHFSCYVPHKLMQTKSLFIWEGR